MVPGTPKVCPSKARWLLPQARYFSAAVKTRRADITFEAAHGWAMSEEFRGFSANPGKLLVAP
jgi:hypothetical protein